MNCSRCSRELAESERYVYSGKVYCEDCLMTIGLTAKECDPWATYVETSDRKRHGDTGADSLNEIQSKIYNYVKSKRKVSQSEVMKHVGLEEDDFILQIRPIMHSELVKEITEAGVEYLVPIG